MKFLTTDFSSRSSWLLLCLGLLAGVLLTASLQAYDQRLALAKQDQHYGEALAALAARQAVDATLNHDLVSLQVILRDIATNPRIENATIHDVENRLLVQAGSTPNLSANSATVNFSAPITFHNSVAGYVTLSLQQPKHSALAQSTVGLGVVAIAALLILALRSDEATTASQPLANEEDSEESSNSTESKPVGGIPIANLKPMMSDMPAKKHAVELNLHIKNLEALQRQLSSPLLKQLLDNLEQQVKGVCALYKGQLQTSGSTPLSHIRIKFRGTDSPGCTFNALCSAHLLQRFAKTPGKGISLQLNASITHERDNLSLMEQINNHSQQQADEFHLASQLAGSLLIQQSLLDNEQLPERLQMDPLDAQWHLVAAIQPPYIELLDKQFEQLKELHS